MPRRREASAGRLVWIGWHGAFWRGDVGCGGGGGDGDPAAAAAAVGRDENAALAGRVGSR
jgi:hypothetical protein